MYCDGCGMNMDLSTDEVHMPPPEGIPHCDDCCSIYYHNCPDAQACTKHDWGYEIEAVEIEGEILYLTRTCMEPGCKASQPAIILLKESDFDTGG